MERKDIGDDFGFYTPSGVGTPFLKENSGNNEPPPPPPPSEHLLGLLPPSLNSQMSLEKTAAGNSSVSRGSTMSENQSPENLNIYWKCNNEAPPSPPQHRLGSLRPSLNSQVRLENEASGNSFLSRGGTVSENQNPEILDIYWKGDMIEEAHSSLRRNQEQRFPVPGSNSSNNFDLETAMSLLSLSNTANHSSANGGGGVGRYGANYGANFFDHTNGGGGRYGANYGSNFSDPTFNRYPIPCRRLPSYAGTSNGFSSSSSNGDDRRFSLAVQRQLRRERYADSEFSPRNSNNLLYPSANARFQQRLLLLSLDELRGQLYFIAKDQYGSSFLEKKLLDRNPTDIEIIYWEIEDYLCELMIHQFAHHVVDKLIEVGNPSLVTGVLHSIISNEHNFIALCNDSHGTHGVQKLLEHLTSREQISMAVSALRRVVLILSKNIHGQHVIKCCVNRFTSQDNKELLNEVAKNCLEIARDKTGCCVLQDCVVQADGEVKDYLLESIVSNSLVLSKDPYGNFVVQNALQQNISYVTEEIIKRLSGSFGTLCFDKFGSHVVERCLSGSNDNINQQIITELIYSQDFLSVVQSPFGNYVIQTALMTSKGVVYDSLVNRIHDESAFLYSHPFGRKVLLRVRDTRSRSFLP